MENKKRENGFYYVMDFGQWIVAEWKRGGWFLAGIKYKFNDESFAEIDERRVERVEREF